MVRPARWSRKGCALLWCADPERLAESKGLVFERPLWLVSAAPADVLGAWFDAHPWMASLGFITFNEADGPAFVAAMQALDGQARQVKARTFQPPGEGFYSVAGPTAVVDAVRFHETPRNGVERIEACIDAAADVARALGDPVMWEVAAEHSGGLLAVGLAARLGRAVACSSSMPHALATIAATRHGVNLQVFTDAAESERASDLGFGRKT